MAMAHSYDEGPAWREAAGLSPITWVDDTGYGARYSRSAPAARTAELARRQAAPRMSPEDELAYSQEAQVLGSTANYLMYEYGKQKNELLAAARRGDAEKARMIVDAMRSWTDENRGSLVRWKNSGADKDSVAGQLSANAFALDSESYLDDMLYPQGSEYNTTVRALLDSRTPEAKAWAAESAKKSLGLGSAAAAVYSDPDNPLYDALAPQRTAYQAATVAIGRARGKKDVDLALEDQRNAEVRLQVAAEFAAGHGGDDPELVRGFLKGAQRSSWFGNASRNRLDDLFQMYSDDVGSGRARDSADWFGQLDESLSAALPTQRRLVPQADGSTKVVEEQSQATRPDRLPGMLVQARGILDETRFGATDYRTVSAALKKSVQKADVLARMAGVDDPQLIGLGDAPVADAVYGLTGDESLLQASYRGTPLRNNGRSLDDAYAGAVRLANVMGVNVDELTPVNGASADAPGLLGSTAVGVYRAILRHRLGGDMSDDALDDRIAGVLSRGDRGREGEYRALAREVREKIARNEEAGLKMDFGQVLREIGGGVRVEAVQTQDGGTALAVKQVVPPGNRAAVDYATGAPMVGSPTEDAGALSTDSGVRRSLNSENVYAADRALEVFATQEGAIPYESALEKAGLGSLVAAVKGSALGILKAHRDADFQGGSGSTKGMAKPVGELLFDNMKQMGVGFSGDDAAFVKDGLIQFLDGHDKWVGTGSGDKGLNLRAVEFTDALADRIGKGDISVAPLFARMASEIMNRSYPGVLFGEKTTQILSEVGAVKIPSGPDFYANRQIARRPRDLSDAEAQKAYEDMKDKLTKRYGPGSLDILAKAGYKDHDIGKIKEDNDYAKVFRIFDLNWRRKAPVAKPVTTVATGPAVAQVTQTGTGSTVEPPLNASAANAANRLLSTMSSADDELSSMMSELLGRVAPQFHDPKAAQYYVMGLKPLLQDKLRREGSASARAYVERQGTMRRHVVVTGQLADGTLSYGQVFISPEDEQAIIARSFGNDASAYHVDQANLAIQKDKYDSVVLSGVGKYQVPVREE